MRITRIYTPQSLEAGITLCLEENAAHHVSRVLRLPLNAVIHLFNGEGQEYVGKISALTKREVIIAVEQQRSIHTESPLAIHLGQVISRGDRMDITLQKATELGVTAITPLTSDFCQVKLDKERLDKKMLHWQGVIISACEQSGRATLPLLHAPLSLKTWVESVQAAHKLILEPTAGVALKTLHSSSDFALLIGSEGGFSEKELELAHQQRFVGIKLGPRILRTETASLAAIAALQILFGDL